MPSPLSPCLLENGNGRRHGRTPPSSPSSSSSSSMGKDSDTALVFKFSNPLLRTFLANLQKVILGTKLSLLLPAIPLAIAAQYYGLRRPWIFLLSSLGLIPLAERISFLTEQIAFYTGPTVGGLVNATCGNATELIIAILALTRNKVDVVKYSLLGSVLSNLLLVLGTSLFCSGIANLDQEQKFDRKQADVNSLLLLMALLCHTMPLLLFWIAGPNGVKTSSVLQLSRASSIVMLIAYIGYLIFQLRTHRQMFEAQKGEQEQEEEGNDDDDEAEVIGFWSGLIWLVGMTLVIALLSEFIVGAIEEASETWGVSVSFVSIILLPIVGNAAEHTGAIIFALKNKLDISLGVALGSATQISLFVFPLCVIVAWITGTNMDLHLHVLETVSLALSILVTAFTLQDGTSHYMKGLVLLLCYIVIGTCFFVFPSPLDHVSIRSQGIESSREGAFKI